jgi:hypothetical protein
LTNLESLAHSLKLRFGLDPSEPNAVQLAAIISAIQVIKAAGHYPTEQDWAKVVAKNCPTAGTWKYAGLDNSDLNVLLALALQSIPGK